MLEVSWIEWRLAIECLHSGDKIEYSGTGIPPLPEVINGVAADILHGAKTPTERGRLSNPPDIKFGSDGEKQAHKKT